jgi:hypothetical protein
MFRSVSRVSVAVALVLAFLLSTVPAQAQPRDLGSSRSIDISWFEAALSWLEGLLGSDSAIGDKKKDDGLDARFMTGPCIDPSGTCIGG